MGSENKCELRAVRFQLLPITAVINYIVYISEQVVTEVFEEFFYLPPKFAPKVQELWESLFFIS